MKLSNIVVIITGLMFLLWLAGINENVGIILGELDVANNPLGIGATFIFTQLTTILLLATGAAIAYGLITKQPIENIIMIPIVLFFLKFISDWLGIILLTNGYCEAFTAPLASCAWVTYLVMALVIPIAVVYVMAVADWWRGRDS